MAREHTVRAAGADKSLERYILGKFPLSSPDLRTGAPEGWTLQREQLAGGGREWTLQQEGDGSSRHRGVADGGLTGSSGPSNYFVLVKQRGSDDFLAIPVHEWATFKPAGRRGPQSLEDAEAQMKYQRLQAARANPRLAQIVRPGNAAPGGLPRAEGEEDADSDEEWKDIKARAASRTAAGVAPPVAARAHGNGGGEEDDLPAAPAVGAAAEEVFTARPKDAEDWEHEAAADDDDLDMGDGEEGDVEVSPVRRGAASSDSDGEGAAGRDAAKVKKSLKKMMRQTGLDDSEGSDGGEEEEDDDDDEDLDEMAAEVLPGTAPVATGSRKRKTPPPAPAPAVAPAPAPSLPPAAAPAVDVAAKRQRLDPAAAPAPAAAPGGMPTEAEVVALLRFHGRMPLGDIVSAFGARLLTAQDRKTFTAIVKAVAKLDPTPNADGRKCLVLK